MSVGLRRQRRASTLSSVPCPSKGLNAVDPLAVMDAGFCIQLDNWLPTTTGLTTLQGYKEHCTGLGGEVRTLATYNKWDGTVQMFGMTDVSVWDVTESSSTPIAVYGITNGRVDTTQFATVANTYLICANGTDPMFMWNGTAWITFTEVVGPTDPGEISGVDPADISVILAYKRRLWLVEKNTMTAYYLPTDAVAGAATPFYLGGVFTRGGYIVDIMSWSFNSGAGLNAYLVFRSSAGEIAVYQGSDPSDADTWTLVSVYFVAPPIGERSSVDFGGDSLLLTSTGLIPISKIAQGSATEALFESTLTRYINPIISQLFADSSFADNWEIQNFSSLQGVVIGIPSTPDTPAVQFFMNTVTGAWSRIFLPARCFTNIGARIFFGDDNGRVLEYGVTGLADVKLDGTGGEPVDCYLFSAYNYLDNRSTLKHFKMIRPTFQADSEVLFRLVISTDFDINALTNQIGTVAGATSADRWDAALWDAAIWRTSLTVSRPWTTVLGIGMCAAVVMRVASDNPISLASFDWVYEPGSSI